MMCFRDMTFCTFHEDCIKAKDCSRPLTDEVKADAERWMKNVPICQFMDKPVEADDAEIVDQNLTW